MTTGGRSLKSVAALVCLLSAGCGAPDVNPAAPRANTGYVDFYTDSALGLSWQIKRADGTGQMHKAFLDYSPTPGNIVRLAAPAGTHRFEVWFNNRFTTGPQTVVVEVANAMVTPVHVSLNTGGSSSVRTESYEYRNTRRGTRQVATSETEDKQTFQIGLASSSPAPYQPKERMPYYR